jgi:hypothetical protein
VTLEDPPVAVIRLTTVTWQISPSPGVFGTPLLQVVVDAIVVVAETPPASDREARSRRPPERRMARERRMETT